MANSLYSLPTEFKSIVKRTQARCGEPLGDATGMPAPVHLRLGRQAVPVPHKDASFPFGSASARMPPRAIRSEIVNTYGYVRWGCIRGITLGINRGCTLEDHPQHTTKPQVTDTEQGSGGVPDSLDHKPVDTSGRAGRSCCPCLLSEVIDIGSPSQSITVTYSIRLHCYFISAAPATDPNPFVNGTHKPAPERKLTVRTAFVLTGIATTNDTPKES